MSDTYTEVTRESWGERIGGSFKNILGGFTLIAAGILLLFWNEGRTVKRARALSEGQGIVKSIDPIKLIEKNHKLAHFSGSPILGDAIIDTLTGVTSKGLKLIRSVEMYQWKENITTTSDKKVGGAKETTKEYKYEKVWSKSHQSSKKFKVRTGHENPPSLPYKGKSIAANGVKVGEVKITSSTLSSLNCGQSLSLKGQTITFPSMVIKNDSILFSGVGTLAQPKIGDIKMYYRIVNPKDISVVAQLKNGQTTAYQASNDNSVELTECGTHTSEAMFASAQKSNSFLGWMLRLAGLVLIFIGFKLILEILVVLGDVIPFIGSIVGIGTSIVAGVLAFAISLIVCAIAWLYFRPILAITLLVIAGAILAGVFYMRKKQTPTS